jgi:hypothetical protein
MTCTPRHSWGRCWPSAARCSLRHIEPAAARRLVQAYATWHVMRRLRANAGKGRRPRTYTAYARNNIRAAADFTAWLARHGRSLQQCRQADIDDWLVRWPRTFTGLGPLKWFDGG